MAAQGFTNFTAVALDGTKTAGTDLEAGPAPAAPAASSADVNTAVASTAAAASSAVDCGPISTTIVTVTVAVSLSLRATRLISNIPQASSAASTKAAVKTSAAAAAANTQAASAAGARAVSDPVTGTFEGFVASTISGLDFGLCVPTLKFELGLNNRKATEGTFQAIDPLVNKGQQEALNPNIITNRIKDQLTNVCGANQAAKDAVAAAAAQVAALGTRDATTADVWNTALGFDGANTNPDNAPVAGLVGHT